MEARVTSTNIIPFKTQNTESNVVSLFDYAESKGYSIGLPVSPSAETAASKPKLKKEKYTVRGRSTTVSPFRKEEYILNAKNYFLTKQERYKGQNIRDYAIFVFGINLARRCGDLLHFRIDDVFDENYEVKNYIVINEQKTGKTAKIPITPVVKEAALKYLASLNRSDLRPSDFLFPSRNRDKKTRRPKAMTVETFCIKLHKLRDELEIVDPIGTHSMRKTWVYMLIKNNPNDIRSIIKASKYLGHNDVETTFAYAGFAQEEMDEVCFNNQL